MPATDLKSLAVRYIQAAGDQNYAVVSEMLAADVRFRGAAFEANGPEQVIAMLKRMAPVWKKSVVRAAFTEGDKACVVYDFVTDTAAGSVPCVELITFRGELIAEVQLMFDRVQFAPASEELAKRAIQQ